MAAPFGGANTHATHSVPHKPFSTVFMSSFLSIGLHAGVRWAAHLSEWPRGTPPPRTHNTDLLTRCKTVRLRAGGRQRNQHLGLSNTLGTEDDGEQSGFHGVVAAQLLVPNKGNLWQKSVGKV